VVCRAPFRESRVALVRHARSSHIHAGWITALKEKRLLVTFVNGIQKVYECQTILNLERFQLLKQEAFL
jgi:hypothetical protein